MSIKSKAPDQRYKDSNLGVSNNRPTFTFDIDKKKQIKAGSSEILEMQAAIRTAIEGPLEDGAAGSFIGDHFKKANWNNGRRGTDAEFGSTWTSGLLSSAPFAFNFATVFDKNGNLEYMDLVPLCSTNETADGTVAFPHPQGLPTLNGDCFFWEARGTERPTGTKPSDSRTFSEICQEDYIHAQLALIPATSNAFGAVKKTDITPRFDRDRSLKIPSKNGAVSEKKVKMKQLDGSGVANWRDQAVVSVGDGGAIRFPLDGLKAGGRLGFKVKTASVKDKGKIARDSSLPLDAFPFSGGADGYQAPWSFKFNLMPTGAVVDMTIRGIRHRMQRFDNTGNTLDYSARGLNTSFSDSIPFSEFATPTEPNFSFFGSYVIQNIPAFVISKTPVKTLPHTDGDEVHINPFPLGNNLLGGNSASEYGLIGSVYRSKSGTTLTCSGTSGGIWVAAPFDIGGGFVTASVGDVEQQFEVVNTTAATYSATGAYVDVNHVECAGGPTGLKDPVYLNPANATTSIFSFSDSSDQTND